MAAAIKKQLGLQRQSATLSITLENVNNRTLRKNNRCTSRAAAKKTKSKSGETGVTGAAHALETHCVP